MKTFDECAPIKTLEQVEAFASHLRSDLCTIFHPDDDFKDHIDLKTGMPSFTQEHAERLNKRMQECFDVCEREGKDVYETMSSTENQ